nr:hypothetical protein [Paenibacillus sp. oral taxon 786]
MSYDMRDNLGGVFFSLAPRVSYPKEIKMKAIEMRMAGIPVKYKGWENTWDFGQRNNYGLSTRRISWLLQRMGRMPLKELFAETLQEMLKAVMTNT